MKKISSSGDLLVSHDRLRLYNEAITTKVTSCEPHVNISTITQSAIFPCASPSNASTHNISTSCDELYCMPCCSNKKLLRTQLLVLVLTIYVQESKELNSKVTSLTKDF
jgi:hypothetical protein